MDDERIKYCITRHPDWDDRRVSRAMLVPIAAVRDVRKSFGPGQAKEDSGAGLVSLERVKARYDIKAAILREIGKLGRGKLISENELCDRTAGKDRNRFRRAVENGGDELGAMRIRLRLDDASEGKWYWGHAADIAEATRIRDL